MKQLAYKNKRDLVQIFRCLSHNHDTSTIQLPKQDLKISIPINMLARIEEMSHNPTHRQRTIPYDWWWQRSNSCLPRTSNPSPPPPKKNLVVQYQVLSPEMKHTQTTLNRFSRLHLYICAYITIIIKEN